MLKIVWTLLALYWFYIFVAFTFGSFKPEKRTISTAFLVSSLVFVSFILK